MKVAAVAYLIFAIFDNLIMLIVAGGLYGLVLGTISAQLGSLIRCINSEQY